MITTIITNFLAFINSSSWVTKTIMALLIWFTPAVELFLLLIVIMTVDYILDIVNLYRKSKPEECIKKELWNETKLWMTKVFYYSLLVILMNGLQLHLIKDSFDLFRWIVAIPIISESLGIMNTIEKYTGIKVIASFKKFFKGLLSKEGVDDSIIDDIEHNALPHKEEDK